MFSIVNSIYCLRWWYWQYISCIHGWFCYRISGRQPQYNIFMVQSSKSSQDPFPCSPLSDIMRTGSKKYRFYGQTQDTLASHDQLSSQQTSLGLVRDLKVQTRWEIWLNDVTYRQTDAAFYSKGCDLSYLTKTLLLPGKPELIFVQQSS